MESLIEWEYIENDLTFVKIKIGELIFQQLI